MTGVGCLLAAAALGAVLHGTRGPTGLDLLAARVIGPPSPVPATVALAAARLADREPAIMYFLLVAVAGGLLYRHGRPIVAVLASGAAAQGLVLFGKHLVDRTAFTAGPSYPSGHMAGATAVWVLVVLLAAGRGRRAAGLVGLTIGLLPVATALGAIWTQSHVWTDVLGGGLIGTGTALLSWWVFVPPVPVRPLPPHLPWRTTARGNEGS